MKDIEPPIEPIGITPPNDWMKDRLVARPVTPDPLGDNNFRPPSPPAQAIAIPNNPDEPYGVFPKRYKGDFDEQI